MTPEQERRIAGHLTGLSYSPFASDRDTAEAIRTLLSAYKAQREALEKISAGEGLLDLPGDDSEAKGYNEAIDIARGLAEFATDALHADTAHAQAD